MTPHTPSRPPKLRNCKDRGKDPRTAHGYVPNFPGFMPVLLLGKLDFEIQTRLTVPPSAEFPSEKQRCPQGGNSHLGHRWSNSLTCQKKPSKNPKTTKPLFPDTCGETHRERVNLLMAKLTLGHKETFPGLCREAALPTHPCTCLGGGSNTPFLFIFSLLL